MPPRGGPGPKKRAAPGGGGAAPVAAKLAKPEKTTWYFMSDLRKTKAGTFDEKAWKPFDATMTGKLETAYNKGQKQVKLTFKEREYIVKFADMMQYRVDDKNLQRPIKRVEGTGAAAAEEEEEAEAEGEEEAAGEEEEVMKKPAAAPKAGGRAPPPEPEEAAETEPADAPPPARTATLPTRG
mmetsp:Transcript_84926/g.235531  ORF Transcript_84926/g.235531 Transcript_84926/m.235531 type:complete len:182 (-) Transcript_84926:91-636(-)|eukprot:CAMPEP_0179069250 /NCGR_PEP_ID=MMETSP0796-20121207/30412_1 /TAXON_ID=73915 /ORGANISM="Pyrodinium bahamense, Strain pbaha01" /LENGTH=181 /DNA_ID=CAMNT_0020766313 /DNA_START=90 /DNA_END=635 /DNA_ORIENTATION=-